MSKFTEEEKQNIVAKYIQTEDGRKKLKEAIFNTKDPEFIRDECVKIIKTLSTSTVSELFNIVDTINYIKSEFSKRPSICIKCNMTNEYVDFNPNYICYECK